MKIISIEGLDKSGKHTISEHIVDRLRSKGFKVAKMEFPNYESEIGKLIRKWLREEISLSNKTFELLMAADKQEGQVLLDKYELENYDFVVIDRYIHSQLAYGQYKNRLPWLKALIEEMIEPDYVFYLYVSPEESIRRKGQHGENDKYEKDLSLLETLHDYYQKAFMSTINKKDVININANKELTEVIKEVDLKLYIFLNSK